MDVSVRAPIANPPKHTYSIFNRRLSLLNRNLILLAADFQHSSSDALDLTGGIPAAFYSKSLSFTPETLIPSSGVDDLFHFLDTANSGGALWFVIFDLEAGAINDVPMNATAYAHRDTLFWLQSYAIGAGHVSQRRSRR